MIHSSTDVQERGVLARQGRQKSQSV
jgi:hypothetical protein